MRLLMKRRKWQSGQRDLLGTTRHQVFYFQRQTYEEKRNYRWERNSSWNPSLLCLPRSAWGMLSPSTVIPATSSGCYLAPFPFRYQINLLVLSSASPTGSRHLAPVTFFADLPKPLKPLNRLKPPNYSSTLF